MRWIFGLCLSFLFWACSPFNNLGELQLSEPDAELESRDSTLDKLDGSAGEAGSGGEAGVIPPICDEEGLAGNDCINDCADTPCLNQGVCIDEINGYTCDCSDTGFIGDHCDLEIDYCSDIECQNGGICINGFEESFCDCQDSGFEGDFCEVNIDDCAQSPCLNRGLCVDLIGGYECNCNDTGFDGDLCQNDVNECLLYQNLCSDDSFCKNLDGSYECPPCNCNIENTLENQDVCDEFGQCICVNGFGDMKCDLCEDGAVELDGECKRLRIFVTAWTGDARIQIEGSFVSSVDNICNVDQNRPDRNKKYKALISHPLERNVRNNWPLLPNTSYYRDNDFVKIGTTNQNKKFVLNPEGGLDNSMSESPMKVWTGFNFDFEWENPRDPAGNCRQWTFDGRDESAVIGMSDRLGQSAINDHFEPCDSQDVHLYCVESRCGFGYTGDSCNLCDYGFQDNDRNGSCEYNCEFSRLDCGPNGYCNDQAGEPHCECREGFVLNFDQSRCVDIDECDIQNGGCDFRCTNTNGSFECFCDSGYSLGFDGFSCHDINECDDSTSIICHQICTNTDGGFECSCYEDHQDHDNDGICERSCLFNDDFDCGEFGHCTDQTGMRSCVCDDGYFYIEGVGCVGSCIQSGIDCGDYGYCDDTSGEIFCICEEGAVFAENECRRLGIFVTNNHFNGNLGGGIGADEKCNIDRNAEFGRYYKALIGIPDVRDYYLEGWPLMRSTSYYRTNNKRIKIGTTTEDGRFNIEGGHYLDNPFTSEYNSVWTGLNGYCEVSMYNNCWGWTSSNDDPNDPWDDTLIAESNASRNNYAAISAWGATCDELNRLYCVEQACPEGYSGPTCNSCDFGYQDNDNDGRCDMDCERAQLECGPNSICSDQNGFALCVLDL